MWGWQRLRAVFVALLVALLAACFGGASAMAAGDSGPRVIYAHGGEVYLVDAESGAVQWLDPVSLRPRVPQMELGEAVGRPVVDTEGILWAPSATRGRLFAVYRGTAALPLDVAAPGHPLRLTLANGRLVATDLLAAKVLLLEKHGIAEEISLDDQISDDAAQPVKIPPYTESAFLPLLAQAKPWKRLLVVNLDTGRFNWLGLGPVADHELHEPQAWRNVIVLTDGEDRSIRTCALSEKWGDGVGQATCNQATQVINGVEYLLQYSIDSGAEPIVVRHGINTEKEPDPVQSVI